MRSFGSLFKLRSLCYGLLSVSVLLPISLQAKHLQPAEALSAAMQSAGPTKAPALQAKSLELCYEMPLPRQAEAAVYVFSGREGGFAVVAADDDAPEMLLGYSDTSRLDVNNLSTGFVWALQQYAAYVQCAIDEPMSARAPADYAAVEPICKTTWDQTAPYYNDCPLIDGKRAVTGCVATATAQLMKVHNWPKTGTGETSYTFDDGNYTQSFDFGNTTFDWDNMLDSYSGQYTTEQGNAVATLMHACGVAAQMEYSADESAASDVTVAMGLLEYLKYDKQLTYLSHSWFTNEEWEDLIYDQLRQGLPVMICGVNDQDEGHSFVCDGCDNSGYYHINWGWSGYCDGYFSLFDLHPISVGTGGGSGISGFNNEQSTLINLKPETGNSQYTAVMLISDVLTAGQSQYTIGEGTYVEFVPTCEEESDAGIFSLSLGKLSITVGAKLDIAGGPQYIEITTNTLQPFAGYDYIGAPSTAFPEGEYNVSLVYKANGSDWKPMYYDRSLSDGTLHFVVQSGQITISQPSSAVNSIPADNADPAYYNLQGIKLPGKPASGMYIRVDGNKGQVRI